MRKSLLAAILALSLLLSPILGCAATVNADSLLPVSDEKIEMDMVILKGAVAGDPEDIWFWDWLEEKTNIHWNITEIDSTVWEEKKSILLLSGEYPDVFWGPTFTNSEIMNLGAEGVFIPLNDLIDTYADEVTALLDMIPGSREDITCPDGNIYSMPTFSLGVTYSDYRAWINEQWLDNLGLDMPTTLDEFYNVLLAFKEQDADLDGDTTDEIPWGGCWETEPLSGRSIVLAAVGFINKDGENVAVKDGEACYMPLHEDYRAYLEFCNKCWEAGLMDPDLFTQTETQYRAKLSDICVGYAADWCAYSVGGYDPEGYEQYVHVIPLTSEENDTPIWYKSETYSIGSMEITDKCEYPELAIRWANCLYNADIAIEFQNGPIYGSESDPDLIGWDPESGTTEPAGLTTANPDGLGWWDYLCEYVVPRGRGGTWYATIDDYYALEEASIGFERVVSGEEGYWRTSNTENAGAYFTAGYPTVVFYSDEDNQTLKELLTPLDDYVETMEAKFITGAESFDNYDKFIEELKALGAEQVDAIYRTTYEASKAE